MSARRSPRQPADLCRRDIVQLAQTGYGFAAVPVQMEGITIAWREGSFKCEYRREATSGWLSVFSGDELVAREPQSSVSAACTRARELTDQLAQKRAKRA